jgi:hypothetical protein
MLLGKQQKQKENKVPYGVQITAGGTDYSFVLDTEQGVRELVENSMRVTAVRVWNENEFPARELTKDEVSKMMRFDEAVV